MNAHGICCRCGNAIIYEAGDWYHGIVPVDPDTGRFLYPDHLPAPIPEPTTYEG